MSRYNIQNRERPSRKSSRSNQSYGVAAVLSPDRDQIQASAAKEPRSAHKQSAITDKVVHTQADAKILTEKLCDACLNQELTKAKTEKEAARLAEEHRAHQQSLDHLREEEERLGAEEKKKERYEDR